MLKYYFGGTRVVWTWGEGGVQKLFHTPLIGYLGGMGGCPGSTKHINRPITSLLMVVYRFNGCFRLIGVG